MWQDHDFLRPEETEDEMITRIGRWRSKHDKAGEDGPRTLSPLNLDSGQAIEENVFYEDEERTGFEVAGKNTTPITDSSGMKSTDNFGHQANLAGSLSSPISKLRNSMCLERPSERLRLRSRKARGKVETTDQRLIWSGRLRSRTSNSTALKPQGVVKRSDKKQQSKQPSKTLQPPAPDYLGVRSGAPMSVSSTMASSVNLDGILHQAGSGIGIQKPRRSTRLRHSLSNLSRPQGVQKAHIPRNKTCNARERNSQKHRQKDFCLPTPPRSR